MLLATQHESIQRKTQASLFGTRPLCGRIAQGVGNMTAAHALEWVCGSCSWISAAWRRSKKTYPSHTFSHGQQISSGVTCCLGVSAPEYTQQHVEQRASVSSGAPNRAQRKVCCVGQGRIPECARICVCVCVCMYVCVCMMMCSHKRHWATGVIPPPPTREPPPEGPILHHNVSLLERCVVTAAQAMLACENDDFVASNPITPCGNFMHDNTVCVCVCLRGQVPVLCHAADPRTLA